MSDIASRSLKLHEKLQGKLSINSKVPVHGNEDLSLLYTPGVAEPCKEIAKNKDDVYKYTGRGNLVAVISDGSAVLGLGNIGPEAGLPVMEGKSLLLKEFAGVDSIPLVLNSQNSQEIIQAVQLLAPSFGGINLEDISAPRCFEIEDALKKTLTIPVFHDDQHGTAVVVLAALMNACRLHEKKIETLKVVVNGAGAAGTAISKILLSAGVQDLLVCDRHGILVSGDSKLNPAMEALAQITNTKKIIGDLSRALEKSDLFIGVSAAGILKPEMIKKMTPGAFIFAMANPTPEVMPDLALAAGAGLVATGRSDFPNQINNVLAFPGIFRGALDVRATQINETMKLAAAKAISNLVNLDEMKAGRIVPSPFNPMLAYEVAFAVAQAAIKTGVAKNPLDREDLIKTIQNHLSLKPTVYTIPEAEGTSHVLQEKIGTGLQRIGALNEQQCAKILEMQKAGDKRLFGEIALSLGYINFETLIQYLRSSQKED